MSPVLTVTGISKEYPMHAITRTMGHRLLDYLHRDRLPANHFRALAPLSFSLDAGEILGIVGPNGAGKSTLLKILAGVTVPTTGSVTTVGQVRLLRTIGFGMHQELTGRQNIDCLTLLNGLSRKERALRYDQIVEFADIGSFIDVPLKFYSSGMKGRLAFAITIHMDPPDILLLDEAMAAGDIAFRQKCLIKLQEMVQSGLSVVMVSHALDRIAELAHQCLYLHRGQIMASGEPAMVLKEYQASATEKTEATLSQVS